MTFEIFYKLSSVITSQGKKPTVSIRSSHSFSWWVSRFVPPRNDENKTFNVNGGSSVACWKSFWFGILWSSGDLQAMRSHDGYVARIMVQFELVSLKLTVKWWLEDYFHFGFRPMFRDEVLVLGESNGLCIWLCMFQWSKTNVSQVLQYPYFTGKRYTNWMYRCCHLIIFLVFLGGKNYMIRFHVAIIVSRVVANWPCTFSLLSRITVPCWSTVHGGPLRSL